MSKVVIDTETGGLVPGFHEVIEITIMPLDEKYYPDTNIAEFHTLVRPEYPERVTIDALIANKRVDRHAPDKDAAFAEAMEKIMQYPERKETIKAFGEWYMSNYAGKKLSWLCHNGFFDMSMMEHWFLPTHANGNSFARFFNYQGRDTQRIAMFRMDYAKANGLPTPYPGVSLQKLCEAYGIDHSEAHTSRGDCLSTAAVYRKMLKID